MDHLDFVNTSLRLRYEAFSKFATQVNQANSLPEVGEAIAANLKFVLDAFVFRLSIAQGQKTHIFELFRGQCTINTQKAPGKYEQKCLKQGLPLTLTPQDIQSDRLLCDSLFVHPKITHLMVLPISSLGDQQLVLSIANKSQHAYNEIDFRFTRLIGELLSTKVSQLLLIQKIASQNKALQQANQQLSQLNQEVQVLNTELEIKVEERTFRLKEAHEELHTLLYRTSHDFRRPLTSILGIAQLLTMSQSTEEISVFAQHLESTVNGLDNMLVKLQALVLTEVEEIPEAIQFPNLIERLKSKFHQDLIKNAIEFTYQVQLESKYLSRPTILTAILENLIENAIRYRRANDSFVHLEVKEEALSLVIQIADNGEGILEHLQPVIFDMYVKASDRAQGNGLGLFVVKKLADALGGRIHCESAPQKGSTFTLTFPLDQNTVSQPPSSPDLLPIQLSK
ncbi:MAG: HAMP domain-containing sensor histidine kinase [Cyclobacteriaceae bacterium]